MKKVVKVLLWCFALFWVLVLSGGTFLQYYNFPVHSFFLDLKQGAIKTGWYLPAFYAHIIGSSLILVVGFFQFSEWVYSRKKLHRLLGKIYVFGVLFVGAPGAYIMAAFINRGPWVTTSFLLQNTLWVIFTLLAWIRVRNRNFDAHVKMMRRSYALAFGAVTLRFYIFMFKAAGADVDFSNKYILIAFASWIPNLLLAEWINYRGRNKGVIT